jgi:hypothetical protein
MLHDSRESYRREDDDFWNNASSSLRFVMIVLIALALSSALIFASLRFGRVAALCPLGSYCGDHCGCALSIPEI